MGVSIEWLLHLGARFTGVIVIPDVRWPGMWRVRHGVRLSDMVNLSRAKDAAITWARPRGLGGGEVVRWERRGVGKPTALPRRIEQTPSLAPGEPAGGAPLYGLASALVGEVV